MKYKILFILVLSVLLSGCWNRRELNELALGVGMGIDTKGDNIVMTLQVVDPGEIAAAKGGSGRSPITIYQVEGKTTFECMRKMTTIAPRKIYLAHLRILVLGNDLVKKGITDIMDFLLRDHELRSDFYVVISGKEPASKMLEYITPLDPIPAQYIYNSLTTSAKVWAPTTVVKIDELMSAISSEGKDPVLSTLTFTGPIEDVRKFEDLQLSKPRSYIKYENLSVLKGDKLVGHLSESESKGYNYILGNVHSTVGRASIPSLKKVLVVELAHPKANITTKMKNGTPTISIQVSYNFTIAGSAENINFQKTKYIKELEQNMSKRTAQNMRRAIIKAKSLESDIFGFGDVIHKNYPKQWKKLKKNWNEEGFVRVPVEIEINPTFTHSGTIKTLQTK